MAIPVVGTSCEHAKERRSENRATEKRIDAMLDQLQVALTSVGAPAEQFERLGLG